MKSVVVLQSNYIPWKGYFDLIHDADVFFFYDDVQYTKNDWRNRNRIKTSSGAQWLTIPVGAHIEALIHQVRLPDPTWQVKHWKTLRQNYQKSPYFKRYENFFEDVYLGSRWLTLSELNQSLIRKISTSFLGLKTEFRDSRELNLVGHKQDRLLDLLRQVGATRYISGPAARSYIEPAHFSSRHLELVWKDYSGYPEYPQRFAPFEHGVSILDLLFQVGPDAPWYIWGWREGPLAS